MKISGELEKRYNEYMSRCCNNHKEPSIDTLLNHMYDRIYHWNNFVPEIYDETDLVFNLQKLGFHIVDAPGGPEYLTQGERYSLRNGEILIVSEDEYLDQAGCYLYYKDARVDLPERDDGFAFVEYFSSHIVDFEKLYQRARIEYRKFLAEEKQRRIA